MSRPYTVGAVQSRVDWKWRIQIKAGNGKIVANGAQPFANKSSADRAALNLSCEAFLYIEPRGLKKV